jgi:prephenate dehydrogenase
VLPTDAVITDVGSTKVEVVARAKSVFGGAAVDRFVGGHPMAGKEHSGVEHADPDLFQNAVWFLTPLAGQNLLAGLQGQYFELLETIGARIVPIEAERHDRVCAWISHLPQMMAIALASTLLEEFGEKSNGASEPTLRELHGIGGRALREMTRIAASPYSWWRDVALTNTTNLEQALMRLEQRLAHIRESLRDPALREEFDRANSFARQMQPRSKE